MSVDPAARARYASAAHRMQSVDAYDLTHKLGLHEGHFLNPQQVLSALCETRRLLTAERHRSTALIRLLVTSGHIDQDELNNMLLDLAEREADARVVAAVDHYGLPEGTNFL